MVRGLQALSTPYAFDGYRPGALAGVVGLHMAHFSDALDFDLAFETRVALELAEFLRRMEPGRDLFLTAWDQGGKIAGSVTVDVTGGGPQGAHLSWFVVSADARGGGLGSELLARAMAFCERLQVPQVRLTTFAGLEAASGLYETHGFRLASENARDQWPGSVREQIFIRARAG